MVIIVVRLQGGDGLVDGCTVMTDVVGMDDGKDEG